MSWTCPHQINNECDRLGKPCQSLQKGCVLNGKVTFIDNQLDMDNEKQKNLKKEDDQNDKIRSHRRI